MPVSLAPLSALATAVFGLLFWRASIGCVAYRAAEALEKPQYSTIGTIDGMEIRRYQPYLIAEVKSKGETYRKATGNGFKQIAGYIFGKNKAKGSADPLKMKMTAPVRSVLKMPESSAPKEDQKSDVTLSFYMGSDYTLNSLPKPLNKNVTLKRVPGHYLAVKKFSGPSPKLSKVAACREAIVKALKDNGLAVPRDCKDYTYLYQYHDPFITPGFLRKNEVGVAVAKNKILKDMETE